MDFSFILLVKDLFDGTEMLRESGFHVKLVKNHSKIEREGETLMNFALINANLQFYVFYNCKYEILK